MKKKKYLTRQERLKLYQQSEDISVEEIKRKFDKKMKKVNKERGKLNETKTNSENTCN